MDIRTERLNDAFNRSGLSQTELCNKTGINKGALSSYLSGRYFPKQKAIEALSAALGVSVYYLMGVDEPSSSTDLSLKEAELLDLFRTLNVLGRDKLVEYARDLAGNEKYIKISNSACAAG